MHCPQRRDYRSVETTSRAHHLPFFGKPISTVASLLRQQQQVTTGSGSPIITADRNPTPSTPSIGSSLTRAGEPIITIFVDDEQRSPLPDSAALASGHEIITATVRATQASRDAIDEQQHPSRDQKGTN
ncbi:hypothetical protein ACLOJK_006667 [Asimina triloba]